MLDEFQRNLVRLDLDRLLSPAAHLQQYCEERLVTAMNFFQFLCVHGHNHGNIGQ